MATNLAGTAPFDFSLAASLFPKLLELSEVSALSHPTQEDPEGRAGKVEVGKQVCSLPKAPLATAHAVDPGDRATRGVQLPSRSGSGPTGGESESGRPGVVDSEA